MGDDRPRAVMTLDLLSQARAKLNTLHMSADRKRLIWTVMVFMFLGSLRGSELLSTDRVKFDPVKTLCGGDLKLSVVKTQGEAVETIQLRLKQPKTSRTNPVQVVELPATGGWLCPVQAWRNWQKSRESNPVGGSRYLRGETGHWSP